MTGNQYQRTFLSVPIDAAPCGDPALSRRGIGEEMQAKEDEQDGSFSFPLCLHWNSLTAAEPRN